MDCGSGDGADLPGDFFRRQLRATGSKTAVEEDSHADRYNREMQHGRHARIGVILFCITLASRYGQAAPTSADDPALRRAVSEISAERLLSHVKTLSSDEFEGRAPGTPGEQRTVDYLVDQFKQFGLAAGGPEGSYIQNVPLVGFTAHPSISFTAGKEAIGFHFPNDAVVWSRRAVAEIKVEESPVVFVGYGVVAPEYGWDDFKDVDVRGKTVLMLINDPPIPDPGDPAKLDPKMFKGEAMTYYGRWTYKFESAAAHGAKGAIIVHQTGPAGYPWGVVMISNGRERRRIAMLKGGSRSTTRGRFLRRRGRIWMR
jgi:hypothetical protein